MGSEKHRESSAEEISFLFAYGTLVPRDAAQRTRQGWLPDAVIGRLYDLGPYPGLVDLNEASAAWVDGFVRPVGAAELVHRLDLYEAVAEGLYRRESTTTREERRAWVYVYNRPLPSAAREPIDRWHGPSGGQAAPSIDRNASALEVTPGGEP